MIQLVGVMWVMAIFFGIIGFLRGINKEVISMSGVILALFGLFQFDPYIRGTLLVNVPPAQIFLFQAVIFIVVVFFAYQTRALGLADNDGDGRDDLQTSVLGAILGFINGYLIWGSLWSFMEATNYPLAPYISAPQPGTSSASFVENLPLAVLGGNDGNLLAAAVIVLFLIVLIVI